MIISDYPKSVCNICMCPIISISKTRDEIKAKGKIKIIDDKYIFYGPQLPVDRTKNGCWFDEVVLKYNQIKRKNKQNI